MRRQIPSTISLICFEAAARMENFARAAESINLTQSTLSRHIKNLELQLQQVLFIRERQRVKLTSAGKQLVGELSPQLERLEATMLNLYAGPDDSGVLNIGVYPTLGSRWLMPIIMRIAEENSGFTPNIITYLHNNQIDPDMIDIAIVQGDPPWSGFVAEYLMPETLVAVASPELIPEPLEIAEELAKYRVLQHTTRPQSWQIWFAGLGIISELAPAGPAFSQFGMLIDAVKRGYGVAILPKVLVEEELANNTLVLAHNHMETPNAAYHLLIPNAKSGNARIERFRKFLLKAASSA